MRLIWKEYMKAALSFIKITPFPLFACLILFLLISCGEKQNYLSGDIEGLESGDRIVLALIDPITDEIYISDTTIRLQRETRIFGILGFLVRSLPHDVPPAHSIQPRPAFRQFCCHNRHSLRRSE